MHANVDNHQKYMCLSFFESNNVSESWWVSSYNTCWLLTTFQSSLEKSSLLVSESFVTSPMSLTGVWCSYHSSAGCYRRRQWRPALGSVYSRTVIRILLSGLICQKALKALISILQSHCARQQHSNTGRTANFVKTTPFVSCWDLQFCMSVKVKFGKIETAECSWVSNWKHQWLTNSLVYSLPVYHLLKIDFKAISIVWTELNVCCICLRKQIKERVGGSR